MAVSHKEVSVKIKLTFMTSAVLVIMTLVVVADYLSPDLIPKGSDV